MSRFFFKFFSKIIILLCFLAPGLGFSSDFNKILNDFKKLGIPKESIGISITKAPTQIYPVKTENFGINQNLPFNPASVVKLVTTRVALDLMGGNHRFETTLTTNGEVINGVLNADVFITGGGDPKLVIEDIEQIVTKLRDSGLNEINGNWIVDDSLFGESEINPSNFDGQPFKPYNVGPNAAMINFKSSQIIIRNYHKRRVSIMLKPELAGVRIKNNLKKIRGGCNKNLISTRLNNGVLRVFGKFGRKCKKHSFYVSLMNHHQFGFSVFKKAWNKSGGKFTGSVFKGKTPENSKLLVKWKSPRPLIELIKDINSMSNNPMARTLFLNLSARTSKQASIEKSKKVVQKWLSERNFAFPEMIIHNGSGLSREVRITSHNLTSLLIDALGDSNAFDWICTLPMVGLEGTVSKRFKNKPIVGNAWLKTGSLKGVQAYSGYIRTVKKNWFVLTILINDKFAEKAKKTMDSLVEWVYFNK